MTNLIAGNMNCALQPVRIPCGLNSLLNTSYSKGGTTHVVVIGSITGTSIVSRLKSLNLDKNGSNPPRLSGVWAISPSFYLGIPSVKMTDNVKGNESVLVRRPLCSVPPIRFVIDSVR